MEKNEGKLKLGEQLSRLEMKNVLGGISGSCQRSGTSGYGTYNRCANSGMGCSGPYGITSGYCSSVWPSSGGTVECC
jgi:hypothetical protein